MLFKNKKKHIFLLPKYKINVVILIKFIMFVRMVPNAEHSLAGHEISLLFGIRAFYLSVMNVLTYILLLYFIIIFCINKLRKFESSGSHIWLLSKLYIKHNSPHNRISYSLVIKYAQSFVWTMPLLSSECLFQNKKLPDIKWTLNTVLWFAALRWINLLPTKPWIKSLFYCIY